MLYDELLYILVEMGFERPVVKQIPAIVGRKILPRLGVFCLLVWVPFLMSLLLPLGFA